MADGADPKPRGGLALCIGVIVIAGFAAYANSLGGQFVYDDLGSIPDNPTLHHLGTSLLPPAGDGKTVEGRPILNLSFALNYALGGTSVEGYHAVNILIHVLAGLALFGIVRRTLGKRGFGESKAALTALAAALLWVLHPLQTEAVSYVVQRAESLMGLFYLSTIYFFVRFAAGGQLSWASLSVASCALGMGTKEVMVTAPVMVAMFDRSFFAGSFLAAWRSRRSYYIGLGATWIVLGLLLAVTGGNRSGSVGLGVGLPWGAYVLTQFKAVATYLRLTVWPAPLVFDYGPFLSSLAEAAPYALPVLALAAASAWALARKPWIGFLGFWFFGILAVTSLTPGTSEMIVERRMYLPLAAPVVLVVLGLERWTKRLFPAVALALALVLGVMTAVRNGDYRTDLSIWSDSVAKVPENSRAQYNLGVAWNGQGRTDLEIARYREALRIDPRNAEALHSLGNALYRQGDLPGALDSLAKASGLKTADRHLGRDYATVLSAAGVQQAQRGDIPEAESRFRAALQTDPGNPGASLNLALALSQSGHFDQAIPHYETALRGMSDNPAVHENFGMALIQAGRPAEAIAHFEFVLRVNPADQNAAHNLEIARSMVTK